MIVFGDPEHGYLIAKKAGCGFDPARDVIAANVTQPGNNLLGGVIFTNYTGASIALHCAGFTPRWISIDMLFVAFDYPFVQLQCSKVLLVIRSSNHKALEFASKLGFITEVIIRDVYPDGDRLADMVILGMDRSACRWLGLEPRRLVRGNVQGRRAPGA